MKKISHIFTLIFLLLFLVSCGTTGQESASEIEWQPLPETYNAKLDETKKVELARERRKEQTQIRKGDYMMSKNNPKDALGFYLPLIEKLPGDVVLYKKIADAYFLLKDWEKAYSYFVRVPISELSEDDQKNMILSLFFREDAIDKNTELQKFAFNENQKDFYGVMVRCYEGIDVCADVLWNYKGEEERLLILQKIVQDSYKVTPDKQYRNLLLAKQLYEYKMFRIVGMFTAEIMANEPNYQEVKKMRAFSLYELWKYTESRDLMLSYFEQNPNDMEIIIRLGEVYTYLGDYVSANLYFNNAITQGYTPKTILERRLAYNYAKLGDTEWMVKVLTYLLQEEDVAEDDFAVAVSLAQEKHDFLKAYAWAYQGMRKFPISKVLAPLYVQSLRLAGKITDALVYVSGLTPDMANLPMIQLEKAILLYENKNYTDAKVIFSELQNYDEEADFAIEAKKYLELIKTAELAATQSWSHEQEASGSDNEWKSFWDF